VRRALDLIDSSYARLTGAEELAQAVGVPLVSLRRKFLRTLGTRPREALEHRRVEEAKRLLAQTDLLAYEVADAVGWGRDDSAARAFLRATGKTMGEYRRSARRGGSDQAQAETP
jgi:transcriptional regulator GlxA family with amidase domain